MMKVEQLMQRPVHTCRADDTINHAVQIMWEQDCGCIPVVDEERHPIGMITDRDACMAAYTQGRTLSSLPVGAAMARHVHACRTGDTLAEAERIMRLAQVRRLPVVDAANVLVGILSLNDLAQEVRREAGAARHELGCEEVADTLGAVCAPRRAHQLATAA
ncbi:MAG: CBS domain-containing protein [bacterium]|nr:CBS domain-containing protein [bacterium]